MVEHNGKFKRVLKRVIYGLIAVILIGILVIILTGNNHFFKLFANTVMKGRLGPSIDEYEIFEYRSVGVGTPTQWPRNEAYNKVSLTDAELAFTNDYGTAAFLVAKEGELIFEKYWGDYSDSSYTNSWSMAKSIVSHLIGCAIKDGLIASENESIGKYLDQYSGTKVTIRDLLTMSSGFNFDEHYLNPFAYPAKSLYGSDIERVHRDYRPNADPGIFFDYQSGNTEVLCFILSKVTKKSVSEYASEKLWKPIGAEHPARWSLDHINGIEKGYCCFNSNARDFAKFGQLYLNKGMVQGDALIDPIYFDMATNQAKLLTLDGKKCTKYGYQWWILDSAEEHIFYARGIQGQYIFILPKSGLVIVRLGHSRTQEQHNGHPLDVYEYIKLGKRLAGVN